MDTDGGHTSSASCTRYFRGSSSYCNGCAVLRCALFWVAGHTHVKLQVARVLLQGVHNQSSNGQGRVRVRVLQCKLLPKASHGCHPVTRLVCAMQDCLRSEQEETLAGPLASAPATRTATRTVHDSGRKKERPWEEGSSCHAAVRYACHRCHEQNNSMRQAVPARLDNDTLTCTLLLMMRKDPGPVCRQPTRGM